MQKNVKENLLAAPKYFKSTIRKESKVIDITSIDKVPETIPKGKEVLPE